MKKRSAFFFVLLLVLTVSFLFAAPALAETSGAESEDGSDCGCSETGSSISASESSGWGAGYGTQTRGATDSGRQEDQAVQNDHNDSVNLIWVNLISISVAAAIVIMLIRYRKSTKKEQMADKTKDTKAGTVMPLERSNERKPDASDKTVLLLAEQLFMQLYDAQRTGDIKILKPNVGQELYQELERQQNANGAGAQTDLRTRAELRNLRIVRRLSENGTDMMIIRVQARLIDRSGQGGEEESKPELNQNAFLKTSYYTMERAEGEMKWKLTQIRRESI